MRLPRTSIAALMGFILILAVAFAALVRPTPLWAAAAFSGMMLALTFAALAALFLKGTRRAFWVGFLVGGSSYLFLQYGPFCEDHIAPTTLPTAVLDIAYAALNYDTPVTQPPTFTITMPSALPTYAPSVAAPMLGTPAPSQAQPVTPQFVPSNPAAPVLKASEPASAPFVADTAYFGQAVQPASPRNDAWFMWTTADPTTLPPMTITTSANFYRIGHSFLSLLVALAFALVARWLAERGAPAQAARAPAAEAAPSPVFRADT